MATITPTLALYNDLLFTDDLEQANYLTRQLKEDMEKLMDTCRAFQSRHGAVPESLCDTIVQIGADLLDQVRDVDPIYQAHLEEVEMDQAWDMRNHYGCEPADYR